MSLRVKVSIALLMVLLLSMGINFLFAFNLFKKDKTSYVFDSLGSIAKSEADVLSLRLQKIAILSPRSFKDGNQEEVLAPLGVEFAAQYERTTEGFKEKGSWKKGPELDGGALRIVESARSSLENSESAVLSIDSHRAVIAFRVADGSAQRKVAGEKLESQVGSLVAALVVDKAVAFGTEGNEDSGIFDLLDTRGRSLLMQENLPAPLRVTISEKFKTSSINSWLSEAGSSGDDPNAPKDYLVSAAKATFGDVIAVRMVSKAEAFASVRKLGLTFGLMFILIFFVSLASGVGVVSKLTAALGQIANAAEEVGRGNYDINIQTSSKDEIGKLALRFNQMAKEVSGLMSQKAEKVRMEAELKTAKEVQDKLFPVPVAQLGGVHLAGFYTPASECGGDWWGYSHIGDKAVLFVGDATGHGAPAALITSAVKATSTLTTKFGMTEPAEIMDALNAAVCATSKGTVCMTFFVATVDLKTGDMAYCNASHEAPLQLPSDCSELQWRDIPAIFDNNHPRLGELPDTVFKSSHRKLNSGETLFVYTDGLLDVRDLKDSPYGERRLAKAVLSSVQSNIEPEQMATFLQSDVETYQSGTALVDDISFVYMKWFPEASA